MVEQNDVYKAKTNKGFSLVELIVVIAIIGILAAVLVPSLTSYIYKTKNNVCDSNLALCNRAMAYDSIFEGTSDDKTFLERCQLQVGAGRIIEKDGYRYLSGLCPFGGLYYLVPADMDDGKNNEYDAQFVVHCTHHHAEESKLDFIPEENIKLSTFRATFNSHYVYKCNKCNLYYYGESTKENIICTKCGGKATFNGGNHENVESPSNMAQLLINQRYNGGTTLYSGSKDGREYKSIICREFGIPIGFKFEYYIRKSETSGYAQTYNLVFNWNQQFPTIKDLCDNLAFMAGKRGIFKRGYAFSEEPDKTYWLEVALPSGNFDTNSLKGNFDGIEKSKIAYDTLKKFSGRGTYFLTKTDTPKYDNMLLSDGYLYREKGEVKGVPQTELLMRGKKQRTQYLMFSQGLNDKEFDSEGNFIGDPNSKYGFYYRVDGYSFDDAKVIYQGE